MTTTQNTVMKPTCCKILFNGFGCRGNLCGNKAKFERDGKHYCGIHDPVTIKEKDDAKNAKWLAERDAIDASRNAARDAQKELERRAACFDNLLEALKELCKTHEWLFDGNEPNGKVLSSSSAVAKAYKAIKQAEETK
jgi:uncharacterized Zn finger protein (UPF0148 family)